MLFIQDNTGSEKKLWKNICLLGGISTILALLGIILDIFIGTMTGGNLSGLPQTAVDRFTQFQDNPFLGLYHLDLLNVINQIILIPAYFAIYIVNRKNNGLAAFSLILFLVGSTLFIANNSALSMLELSRKYAASHLESQKVLFAAAGEAMLAKGAHGSAAAFIGFVLPNIAGFGMSFAMWKGKVFGKLNSFLGITGSLLMLVYLVLVTFVPEVKSAATVFAMPGGLLLMAWMILFTIRLFRLSGRDREQTE